MKARTLNLFEQGQDLPLFTGQPVTHHDEPARQPGPMDHYVQTPMSKVLDDIMARTVEFYRIQRARDSAVKAASLANPDHVRRLVQAQCDENPFWQGRVVTADNIMEMYDTLTSSRKDTVFAAL